MKLTAKDLNGTHIGKTVTIPGNEATYTGRITMITQRHDQTTIQIRDGSLYGVHVPNNTPITIQEGQ